MSGFYNTALASTRYVRNVAAKKGLPSLMTNLLPLLLLFPAVAFSQSTTTRAGAVWEPLLFLVGEWEGHETGHAGIGKGSRSYEFILRGQYLLCKNTSRFEPQEKNPKGEVHQDWTFFSYDRGQKRFVVRQFNVEGFVNHLVLDAQASDARTFVFVSISSENAPAGLRARLTYHIKSGEEFEETFELAPPGKEFAPYLKNYWKKRK